MYIQLTDEDAGYLYRLLEGKTDDKALHLRQHLSSAVLEEYREMDRIAPLGEDTATDCYDEWLREWTGNRKDQ